MARLALRRAGLLLAWLGVACAANAAPLEIPFRYTPGQIEIQVSINGKPPIWCILDSGAEMSMLDRDVAKELGLGEGERIGDVTWQIGPLTMKGQSLTLWRMDNFRRQKRAIRGVIGCELFERYAVTLDFPRRRILLHEPAQFKAPANAASFPLTFAGRLSVIKATLKIGGKTLTPRLMIDTGAQDAVVLRHPYATRHRLSSDVVRNSETLAAGARPFVKLDVEELRLGKWAFANPTANAYGSPSGAGGDTETDGLIGNDILSNFRRVTFDYSRRRLLLEE